MPRDDKKQPLKESVDYPKFHDLVKKVVKKKLSSARAAVPAEALLNATQDVEDYLLSQKRSLKDVRADEMENLIREFWRTPE